MAQILRPISTITDQGNFTGATAHGSVDGAAPDTGDYWNGNDNQTDVLEVLLTDLSASAPGAGTATVSIYETVADTDVAPAAGGSSVTFDIEVYEGATQRAVTTGLTPTDSTFTLNSSLTFAAADITDWSDVRVRVTSVGTGGSPTGRRGMATSYIEISAPDAAGTNLDLTPGVVALDIATAAPTVNLTRQLSPAAVALDIAKINPVVQTVREIAATLAALDIAAQVPVANLTRQLSPATAALDIAKQNPTVVKGVNLAPATIALNIAAQNPIVNRTLELAATLATLTIASQNPTVQMVREIAATLVALNIQGFNPVVDLGGAPPAGINPASYISVRHLMKGL